MRMSSISERASETLRRVLYIIVRFMNTVVHSVTGATTMDDIAII
jgi:hypothetical protein